MTTIWAKNLIEDAKDNKFTGRLEFNFFEGGVSNVNRFESIKPPAEKPIKFMPRTAKALSKNGY